MLERLVMWARHAVRAGCGAAMLAVVLTGCGGSGAGAGGGGASSSSAVADMMLMSEKTALPAADGQISTIVTAQLKDSANRVLANQLVEFSTTDAGVALSPVADSAVALTDTAGKVQVNVELGASSAARLNRTVSVVAKSGELTRTIDILVTGFKLTLSGPDTVNPGYTANYTITALDGANAPVPNLVLTASFDGGSLSSSTLTTNASGQATFTVTAGSVAKQSTLSVTGAGITPVNRSVRILSPDLPFVILAPAAPWVASVGQDIPVKVRYRPSGTSQTSNWPVQLSTTRGQFVGGTNVITVQTNGQGEATATLRSSSVGSTTVTASVSAPTSSSVEAQLQFVSVQAAKITLSPDPTAVSVNAPGSSSSLSRLVATVRDASDNPVTGVRVAFSVQDPSGGRVEPGVVVTGSDGQAVASFVAGPYSTGVDEVKATATVVDNAAITTTRPLTVSAVALFIDLGTGNEITTVDTTTYSMPWTALVTDANRNPVTNQTVTASLVAIRFYKGYWSQGEDSWFFNETARCASEDLNNNNLLDANENDGVQDDADGRLEPGSPAAVVVDAPGAKTGADGRANLKITYPKSFGSTVDVTLKVTIGGSGGTETAVYRTFKLPMLAADLSDLTIRPPSVSEFTPSGQPVGPYGYFPDCYDRR